MNIGYAAMTENDLDRVVEVERESHAFPWTRGNFADSLAAGHSAWIVRQDGTLLGYAVIMQVPDEAHLLNITVVPGLRRSGYGSAILERLFGEARSWSAQRMLLEVRPGNVAALGLYRRHGFAEIGRRRGYYPAAGGREDAIVMARDL